MKLETELLFDRMKTKENNDPGFLPSASLIGSQCRHVTYLHSSGSHITAHVPD